MILNKPITLNRTTASTTRPSSVNLYRGEPYFDGENLWISNDATAEDTRQSYSFAGKTPIAGPDVYDTLNLNIYDTRRFNPQYAFTKEGSANHIGGLKIPTFSNNKWEWTKSSSNNVYFKGIYFDTCGISNCTIRGGNISYTPIENCSIENCNISGSETKIDTCYLKISGTSSTPSTALEGKTYLSITDTTSLNSRVLFEIQDLRTYFGSTPINFSAGMNASIIGTQFPTSPTPARGDIFIKVEGTTSSGLWRQGTLYVRT